MAIPLKENQRYTYTDYAAWDTDIRYELIDGIPYAMASPSLKHQIVSDNLTMFFKNFLRGKVCMAISAPFDVRLNADTYDDIVVQPDLMVVCDRDKLANGKSCVGAPDLIIEILPPSNNLREMLKKMEMYRNAGVREYWVVDPDSETAQVYLLRNGEYVVRNYVETDVIPVSVVDGFEINLAEVLNE